jgi:CubicO group peptidase (beta-lactamase class C family)
MDASKTVGYRKVWRMTARAPMGEILELLPDAEPKATAKDWPTTRASLDDLRPRLPDPAAEPNWQSSSYDLLTGLTVRDVTDTIPGKVFDEVFRGDRVILRRMRAASQTSRA